MTGILSLIVYSPLIGVAGILAARWLARDGEAARPGGALDRARHHLATLALSALMVANFRPGRAGFQFLERRRGLAAFPTAWESTESASSLCS